MSEFNPANVGTTGRTAPDAMPDDPVGAGPAGDLPRRDREGLPSTYRMRADPHYVDLLSAQSERGERPAPAWRTRRASDAAGVEPEPRLDPQDPRGERLLTELSDGLATIASAAGLLASDPSPMARRVGVDLIQAEAWRASWMVEAHALLAGTHRPRVQPRDIGALMAQVREGFAAECRLSGLALDARVPARTTPVLADETAFVTGISGAVLWTVGSAGQVDGGTIVVSVELADGRLDGVEVSYEAASSVPVQAGGRVRGGSAHASDAWTTSLGASAAKAAARLHGGDAAFLAGDGRGSTVRFTFGRTG